jgi:hypothetical protein
MGPINIPDNDKVKNEKKQADDRIRNEMYDNSSRSKGVCSS